MPINRPDHYCSEDRDVILHEVKKTKLQNYQEKPKTWGCKNFVLERLNGYASFYGVIQILRSSEAVQRESAP